MRPDLAIPRLEVHRATLAPTEADGWLDALLRAGELRRVGVPAAKCRQHVVHLLEMQPFSQRLGEIFEGVAGIIHDYAPVEAAVEQVFMARNASAALKLGQARGAAITAIVHVGLPVSEYTPRLVKQAIVGSGAADKSQVGHMVRVLLGIDQPLSEDQGDALAVALCHAHMAETSSRLAKGAGW